MTEREKPAEVIEKISIHTSVWEVTRKKGIVEKVYEDFNPHLRMGGDARERHKINKVGEFQSTPPYGR